MKKISRAENPTDRGELPVRRTAELVVSRGEIARSRHDAVCSNKAFELNPERDERDEVNQREKPQEEPRAEDETIAAGRAIRELRRLQRVYGRALARAQGDC